MTKTSDLILIAKRAAGQAAAELIQEGMLVGIGTGSTTAFFIETLGKRCREGLKISAVATSQQSAYYAQQAGIPLEDPCDITFLDFTVDGADEMDFQKNMIKGGGGALLREKLLAQASQEMIVIIDESKLVHHLGKHPLPVEVVPFLYRNTLQRLEAKGYQGTLRLTQDHEVYLTDNGNYIIDLHYSASILDPVQQQEELKSMTGVVETGLFFNLAGRVIIGYHDGSVKVKRDLRN